MILYKLEFKIDLESNDHKKMKEKIINSIEEVNDVLGIEVSQKFQWFGHEYSFKAEFKEDKSKEILDIFRKYGRIMHSCLEERYITDKEIEVDQHLKTK